jgi:GNAT superfamily N-acetyltransferase
MNLHMDTQLTRNAIALDAATMQLLYRFATPEERQAVGLVLQEIAGATVIASSEGDILVNRAIGLEQTDVAGLDAIVEVFRDVGARRAFITVAEDTADPAIVSHLQALGLPEGRPWRKFHRDMSPEKDTETSSETDLTVREATVQDAAVVGRIIDNAFDIPPELHPALGCQVGHANGDSDGWYVFVSHAGERIAGCGGLFVAGEHGWLTWGATDPAFRQRGSQQAVMAARLACARELGLRFLHTETGEAVPGDPQHSWNNILRAGFRPGARLRNFIVTA